MSELPDTLPIHDLDALRGSVTTLVALQVNPKEIEAMLVAAGAPPAARIEALVVMGQPSDRFRIAEALSRAAEQTDLWPGLVMACRRWGVHPGSVLALETQRPLALGKALGMDRAWIRSFPAKRRAYSNRGHWAPPRGFLGTTMPEDLVLQELLLCEQTFLSRLPERLDVARKVTLDRLPKLSFLGPLPETFSGALEIRSCGSLLGLPAIKHLARLTVDDQPWERFPAAPLEAKSVTLRRMKNLVEIDPDIKMGKLFLSLCPLLKELPHLSQFRLTTPADPDTPAKSPGARTWMPEIPARLDKLFLDACHGIRRLPSEFMVSGALTIQDCWSFEELPEGLQVLHLVLRRLPALKRLPENLHVRGHLVLEGLANLERLPRGLLVEGDLVLHQMPTSVRVEEGLSVRGSIRIHPSDAGQPWPPRPKVFPALRPFSMLSPEGGGWTSGDFTQ